ncbi:hypothetical protein PAXINDRAFT_165748 [Paxillus involutus ATCC 200175]|nr:hypothetical protein PAXINDRAFT_165748 [Paxillus involutus ATCC 200175]
MARPAQEPSRPTTRSMSMPSARRSTRLRGDRVNAISPLSLSLHVAPAGAQLCTGSRKRKRSPTPAEEDKPLRSRPRKKRAQVKVRVERKKNRAGVCESAPGSSGKAATREEALPSREKELEEQLERALRAERDLTDVVKDYGVHAAEATLNHLEEHYTCPLCFEIMACPYALIPRNCGHTFCATCILKWFFSRLGHGYWPETVDCPMCRSALPYTPDQIPRPDFSFPFTPNRTADSAIRGLINSAFHDLTSMTTTVSTTLSDWNKDGHARQEWFKRERTGRTDMTSLATKWNTLKPIEFLAIKTRLEV